VNKIKLRKKRTAVKITCNAASAPFCAVNYTREKSFPVHSEESRHGKRLDWLILDIRFALSNCMSLLGLLKPNWSARNMHTAEG
jgi:hypothetical protein